MLYISFLYYILLLILFTDVVYSAATDNVKVSIVLTMLVLPGSGGIIARNIFEGVTLITPEVLSEVTDIISETTNDLGYQTNVTQPARLGIEAAYEWMSVACLLSLSLSLLHRRLCH